VGPAVDFLSPPSSSSGLALFEGRVTASLLEGFLDLANESFVGALLRFLSIGAIPGYFFEMYEGPSLMIFKVDIFF
jgi:hypothetical protein